MSGMPIMDYARELEKHGKRIVQGSAGTFWMSHERGSLLRIPTSEFRAPSPGEVDRVLRSAPSAIASYVIEPTASAPANARIFLCHGATYDLEKLSKPARRDARRALRTLKIGFIDKPTLLRDGFAAFRDTRARVGLSDGTPENFQRRFAWYLDHKGHDAIAAYLGQKLIAFFTVAHVDDWVGIEGSFSTDADRAACPVNGLCHFALDTYFQQRGVGLVNFGLTSSQPDGDAPGLHYFKRKVGFETVPVHRAFILHPWLRPFANRYSLAAARRVLKLDEKSRFLRKAVGVLEHAMGVAAPYEPPTEPPG